MKSTLFAILMAVVIVPSVAQSNTVKQTPFSVWSIHTPDVVIEGRSPYPVGVLTPTQTIVVRRVEALSNRGPSMGSMPSGEPIACPVQYVLELTNGIVTQTIPLSNTFLTKSTSQTYTDSGPLTLEFPAGNRITLSMVAPKPQFPPVSCTIMGLNVTVQYEMAAPKAPSSDQGQ